MAERLEHLPADTAAQEEAANQKRERMTVVTTERQYARVFVPAAEATNGTVKIPKTNPKESSTEDLNAAVQVTIIAPDRPTLEAFDADLQVRQGPYFKRRGIGPRKVGLHREIQDWDIKEIRAWMRQRGLRVDARQNKPRNTSGQSPQAKG